nr:NAD(+)--rifampin ADP-ribosyltransferase [Pedobacter sp. JY14-1]
MNTDFHPDNAIVKLCMQGMKLEEQGQLEEARDTFLHSWHSATNDFERFLAAWFIARLQPTASERILWYERALELALKVGNDAVRSAFPSLHTNLSRWYHEVCDLKKAAMHKELATTSAGQPIDKGPFYHGTKAQLRTGELLNAGRVSNYQSDFVMNHIYFTALPGGAGLAAALAPGENPERVYIVEPTGSFEDDPNVTNLKFPGNPTRSYRSTEPLKIVGEVTEWQRTTPEQIQRIRDRFADKKGEIIN